MTYGNPASLVHVADNCRLSAAIVTAPKSSADVIAKSLFGVKSSRAGGETCERVIFPVVIFVSSHDHVSVSVVAVVTTPCKYRATAPVT